MCYIYLDLGNEDYYLVALAFQRAAKAFSFLHPRLKSVLTELNDDYRHGAQGAFAIGSIGGVFSVGGVGVGLHATSHLSAITITSVDPWAFGLMMFLAGVLGRGSWGRSQKASQRLEEVTHG